MGRFLSVLWVLAWLTVGASFRETEHEMPPGWVACWLVGWTGFFLVHGFWGLRLVGALGCALLIHVCGVSADLARRRKAPWQAFVPYVAAWFAAWAALRFVFTP